MFQRIDHDKEKVILDAAVHDKLRMNYRIQAPYSTVRALGFNDITELHKMLEEVAAPAVVPHMSAFAEEAVNKKSAFALYDALSAYFQKKYKGANPVTLYKGKVTKGRVKMEVHWLRVGKVFVLPGYQIFNNGLNTHVYISVKALMGFPADTEGTQQKYEQRYHAKIVKGSGPHAITRKTRNIEEYVKALTSIQRKALTSSAA